MNKPFYALALAGILSVLSLPVHAQTINFAITQLENQILVNQQQAMNLWNTTQTFANQEINAEVTAQAPIRAQMAPLESQEWILQMQIQQNTSALLGYGQPLNFLEQQLQMVQEQQSQLAQEEAQQLAPLNEQAAQLQTQISTLTQQQSQLPALQKQALQQQSQINSVDQQENAALTPLLAEEQQLQLQLDAATVPQNVVLAPVNRELAQITAMLRGRGVTNPAVAPGGASPQVVGLVNMYNALKAQMAAINTRIGANSGPEAALQAQLTSVKAQIAAISGQYQAQVAPIQAQLTATDTQITQDEVPLAPVQAQLAGVQSQIQQITSQAQTAQAVLQAQIAQDQAQIAQITTAGTPQQQQQLAQIQNQLNSLTAQLNATGTAAVAAIVAEETPLFDQMSQLQLVVNQEQAQLQTYMMLAGFNASQIVMLNYAVQVEVNTLPYNANVSGIGCPNGVCASVVAAQVYNPSGAAIYASASDEYQYLVSKFGVQQTQLLGTILARDGLAMGTGGQLTPLTSACLSATSCSLAPTTANAFFI